MTNHSSVKLNSSEVSSLWLMYLNNSLSSKIIKHFISNVNDADVRTQLQASYNIVDRQIKHVDTLFKAEGLVLPIAFSESDVDEKAPRLFSDAYYLYYLANMAKVGMADYSLTYYHSARQDVRKFYLDTLIEIDNFYFNLAGLMLSKGVFPRAPIVEITKHADLIDRKNFFAGLFTHPRSLLLKEISNVYENMLTCIIGRTLTMGFAQVAGPKEIKRYFVKGKDMLSEHIEFLSGLLKNEDIPVTSTTDMFLTDSIQAPYSDKLMLYHISMLNVSHFRNFTDSVATSLRSDITAGFSRLSLEVSKYAVEGVNLLIDNGWMEQPPQLVGHKELVGV